MARDREEQVTEYREMAKAMVALAEHTKDEKARIEYYRLAADYEKLAVELEKLAKQSD